jgi:hypothetical protein
MTVKTILSRKGKVSSRSNECSFGSRDRNIGGAPDRCSGGARRGPAGHWHFVRARCLAHVRGIRLGCANQTASANHDPRGRDLWRGRYAVSIMERMTANRVRHIPVVDRDRLVGIVSIGDIVKHRLWEMEQESAALRDYIRSA